MKQYLTPLVVAVSAAMVAMPVFAKEYSTHEGNSKSSGRCWVFYNATDTTQTLKLKAPGRFAGTDTLTVKLSPEGLVSFNRKPKLSLAAGVSGRYTYVTGAELGGSSLNSGEVTKLNMYLAQHLDDKQGCKESPDAREAAVVVLNDEKLRSFGGKEAIGQDAVASFNNGYHLFLPVEHIQKKSFFDRLYKHAEQHGSIFIDTTYKALSALAKWDLGGIKDAISPLAKQAWKGLTGDPSLEEAANQLVAVADTVVPGTADAAAQVTEVGSKSYKLLSPLGLQNKADDLLKELKKTLAKSAEGIIDPSAKERVEEKVKDLVEATTEATQEADADQEAEVAAATIATSELVQLADEVTQESEQESEAKRIAALKRADALLEEDADGVEVIFEDDDAFSQAQSE